MKPHEERALEFAERNHNKGYVSVYDGYIVGRRDPDVVELVNAIREQILTSRSTPRVRNAIAKFGDIQ